MQLHTREEIFAAAAAKMRAEFAELAAVPHAGLKGGEAEGIVREFLNRHLPQRFRAGAGFVIDRADRVSKQIDVLIYDAHNCLVYRASESAGIYPSDNVAAVIEVKSKLDAEKLKEAAENISAAKQLRKTPPLKSSFLINTTTFGCVFAFESALTLKTLAKHYLDILRERGMGDHIDVIAVLDRGMITLCCSPPGPMSWAPLILQAIPAEAEGAHLGIAQMPLKDRTLDAFIRFLLPHLAHFRGSVEYAGLQFRGEDAPKDYAIEYFHSITLERDPIKRKQRLQEYKEQVRAAFVNRPVPTESEQP